MSNALPVIAFMIKQLTAAIIFSAVKTRNINSLGNYRRVIMKLVKIKIIKNIIYRWNVDEHLHYLKIYIDNL